MESYIAGHMQGHIGLLNLYTKYLQMRHTKYALLSKCHWVAIWLSNSVIQLNTAKQHQLRTISIFATFFQEDLGSHVYIT